MQKKLNIFLAILIIGSISVFSTGCTGQTASNADGISAETATADKHTMQTTLDVAGILVPAQSVNIAGKLSGQVTDLTLDAGSNVKIGDTLIVLETKTLNAQLGQAEAALQLAKASVKAVQDQADQAKISLDAAQKAYDQTKALIDSSASTQNQLDDAATNLNRAAKAYQTAIGSAQLQAEASVKTAEANINSVKVQIENAVIISPINGIITNRNINPGEIASPGATLLTIADTSTLKLKGTIPQAVISLLQVGQEINVNVDIYPNKVFSGKIGNIGPMAVSTGEYFPIEINIINSDGIKPGLSAHASLSISVNDGVIIPTQAVVQNNGQSYVYVIKNNVALKRTVILGLKNDKEIEILKGLESGEAVAVTNVNILFDNMPVNAN
jgi:RND family efflux transporter MFP subunit